MLDYLLWPSITTKVFTKTGTEMSVSAINEIRKTEVGVMRLIALKIEASQCGKHPEVGRSKKIYSLLVARERNIGV